MARDPGSVWAPLSEAGHQGSYTKTQFIVHSTGSRASAAANRRYFETSSDNESTFVVGLGPEDPTLQLLDSAERADSNVGANQRAIAVEVVGNAGDPFTDWQVAELIRLGRWSRQAHPGIGAGVCARHDSPGLGWHVMFGAPGPWTTVRGKECPGPRRIEQCKNTIFPAIAAGTDDEELDMAAADDILTTLHGYGRRVENIEATTGELRRLVGVLAGWPGAATDAEVTAQRGPVDAAEARRMLGVLLRWQSPASENEAAALRALYGQDIVVDVDEAAIVAGLAPVLLSRAGTLTDAELERLVTALADEQDRRNRDGDPATGAVPSPT